MCMIIAKIFQELITIINKEVKNNMKGECPGCFFEIDISPMCIVSEVIMCPDCGATLEIIKLDDGRAILEEAEEITEDWGE